MNRRTEPSSSQRRSFRPGNVCPSCSIHSATVPAPVRTSRCPSVNRRNGAGILMTTSTMSSPRQDSRDLALDQVTLDRVDPHARVRRPFDGAPDLVVRTIELEDDPAIISRDVGAANVCHDRKLLSELIDDRLPNELGGKG